MNKSESIKELACALCNMQAALKPALMNQTNPFLKNRYADLGAVIEASKEPMSKNGLAVSQLVNSHEDHIGVETVLMHSSGEWISSEISMSLGEERGKSSAQVAGSIITYMRRYALAAILGIYADEDSDGNEAKPQPKPAAKPEPKNGNGHKAEQIVNELTSNMVETAKELGGEVSYSRTIIDAITKAGYAKNDFEAKGMLSHSVLPTDIDAIWAVAWARVYREARSNEEAPATVEEAAKKANAAYEAAVQK